MESSHPARMLAFLRGRATERKMRLFAVGCCRRICHHLENDHLRGAVDLAERFADGLVADSERKRVYEHLLDYYGQDWAHVPAAVEDTVNDKISPSAISRDAREPQPATIGEKDIGGETLPSISLSDRHKSSFFATSSATPSTGLMAQ